MPDGDRPTRVVIIAGTRAQAVDYAKRTGLSLRQFIYATDTSLRGVGWITSVARVGTWRERRDLAKIEADLAIIQATAKRRLGTTNDQGDPK